MSFLSPPPQDVPIRAAGAGGDGADERCVGIVVVVLGAGTSGVRPGFRLVGRLEEALRWYNMAARLAPADASTENDIGVVYAGLENNRLAIEHFKKAMEIKPDDMDARLNLRKAMRDGGENMRPASSNSPSLQP